MGVHIKGIQRHEHGEDMDYTKSIEVTSSKLKVIQLLCMGERLESIELSVTLTKYNIDEFIEHIIAIVPSLKQGE